VAFDGPRCDEQRLRYLLVGHPLCCHIRNASFRRRKCVHAAYELASGPGARGHQLGTGARRECGRAAAMGEIEPPTQLVDRGAALSGSAQNLAQLDDRVRQLQPRRG
jgi:hypothetical protein